MKASIGTFYKLEITPLGHTIAFVRESEIENWTPLEKLTHYASLYALGDKNWKMVLRSFCYQSDLLVCFYRQRVVLFALA